MAHCFLNGFDGEVNGCFFNSTVQVFFHMKPFFEYFLAAKHKKTLEVEKSLFCVVPHVNNVFGKFAEKLKNEGSLTFLKKNKIDAKEFYNEMKELPKAMKKLFRKKQEDAGELITNIISDFLEQSHFPTKQTFEWRNQQIDVCQICKKKKISKTPKTYMMNLYFQEENNSVQELLEKSKNEKKLIKEFEDCFKRLRENNEQNRTSVEDEKKKLVMEPCDASEDQESGTPTEKIEKIYEEKLKEILKKKIKEKVFLSNIKEIKKNNNNYIIDDIEIYRDKDKDIKIKTGKAIIGVNHVSTIKIVQFPQIFVFQLMRYYNVIDDFSGDVKIKKDTKAVEINKEITHFEHEEAPKKYRLFAVIHHSGTREHGHYWADVRVNNQFYKFNDGIVSRTDLKSFNSSETAYVLFYEKV